MNSLRLATTILIVAFALLVGWAMFSQSIALPITVPLESNTPPPKSKVAHESVSISTQERSLVSSGEGYHQECHGVVRDAVFGHVLEALVEVGDYTYYSDIRTGEFRAEVADRRDPIRISSPGYLDWTGTPDGSRPLEILLKPAHNLRIKVVDAQQRDVPGAAIFASRPGRSRVQLGLTDSRGVLESSISCATTFYAVQGQKCSDLVECNSFYGRIILTLIDACSRIGLRSDVDGTPVADAQLRLRRIDAFGGNEFVVSMGNEGRSTEAIPPGLYEISSTTLNIRFVPRQGIDRFPLFVGTEHVAFVRILSNGETTWLRVEQIEPRSLLLRDEETGVPVSIFSAWVEGYEDQIPGVGWVKVGKTLHANDPSGHPVSVASLLTIINDRMANTLTRLQVDASGYEMETIDNPLDFFVPRIVKEVSCKKLSTGSLRVLTASLAPYRRSVFLRRVPPTRDPLLDHPIVAQGIPDSEGRIYGVPCENSVFSLHLQSGGGAPGVARIDGRVLCEGDAQVVIDADAILRVVVSPDYRASLYCCGLAHDTVFRGVRHGELIVFDQLPPDAYLVGPLAFVQGSKVVESIGGSSGLLGSFFAAQGGASKPTAGAVDRVVLATGETKEITSSLRPGHELLGRINVLGIPAEEILVAPRFTSQKYPFYFVSREEWQRVSPNGSFALENLESAPRFLSFLHIRSDGQRVPLANGFLDSPQVIECAQVFVDVGGAKSGTKITLRFRPLIDGIESILPEITIWGVVGKRLDLGYLPVSTDKLHIKIGNTQIVEKLKLSPGKKVIVRIDAPKN